MPKVTVIIPNYNHAPYLKQRIESVLNQTYQDFEILILDDCSTDNSKNIINSYKNNLKIKQIIFNNENSGSTFKQWDKGLKLCDGDYIWIAESDDFAKPTFLSEAIQPLEMDKNFSCSFVQSIWIDENDKEFARPMHEQFTNEELQSANFVKNKMLDGCYLYNASAVLFRKSVYLNNQNEITGLLNTYKYSGDWLFWVYILKNGKLALVNQSLNYFRRLNNAVSEMGKANFKNLNEYLEILKKILTIYKIEPSIKDCNRICNRIITFLEQGGNENKKYTFHYIRATLKINIKLGCILIYKLIKKSL